MKLICDKIIECRVLEQLLGHPKSECRHDSPHVIEEEKCLTDICRISGKEIHEALCVPMKEKEK